MRPEARKENSSDTEGLPFKERYDKLNQCLYQLEDLLKNMGVSAFSVGNSGRQVIWNSDANTADQQAMGVFCREIEHLHADLVGSSRVDLQACKLEYSIVSPK